MKLLLSFFHLAIICSTISCQSFHYLKSINEFMEFTFNGNKVTINKCADLFGSYILEEEENIFFQKCDSTEPKGECDKLASIHFDNTENSESLLFKIISAKFKENYYYFDNDQLKKNSTIIDYGNPSYIIIKVVYNEQCVVFFQINKYIDENPYIQDIFMNSGESLFNCLNTRKPKSIELRAIIMDKDGFTNIRQEPNNNSTVVGKIVEKQQFFFTPDYSKSWWKVRLVDTGIVGYVHKSRIQLINQ